MSTNHLPHMTSKEFILELNSHSQALFLQARKLTKDYGDAQDLIQDTMLKALKYFPRFEQGNSVRAWLFVIMKNTFINDYRKSIRDRDLLTQSDQISSAHLFWSAEQNFGEGSLVLADIHRALSKLNMIYRNVFVMHFEGYKYEEIAKQMNLPIGTVKTRIYTAREQLKVRLQVYA